MNGHTEPMFAWIALEQLRESPFNIRRHFDPNRLVELAASVKQQGVLQPLVVRPLNKGVDDNRYEIIAGARRYRAAKMAGVGTVPAMVRALSEEEYRMYDDPLARLRSEAEQRARGHLLLMSPWGFGK